jgi:preprotein translocase subunit YajC
MKAKEIERKKEKFKKIKSKRKKGRKTWCVSGLEATISDVSKI